VAKRLPARIVPPNASEGAESRVVDSVVRATASHRTPAKAPSRAWRTRPRAPPRPTERLIWLADD